MLQEEFCFDVKELAEDPAVIKWLDRSNVSSNTRESYLQSMKVYTTLNNKSPSVLLQEAREEVKAGIPKSEWMLEIYLIKYRKFLQDKNLAPTTVTTRLAAIESFYFHSGIDVPKISKGNNNQRARPKKENIKIPTKQELQEVLKVCDPLEKAIILVGISSGLAINDIQELKYADFINGLDKENMVVAFDLRRGKTGVDFFTFLNPEATNAVIDYLNYRNRMIKTGDPRRSRQLLKQHVTEDSYLFINRKIKDSYLETHDEEERKLNNPVILNLYRTIATKARNTAQKGAWNIIRSHNMRKYFNSTLINNGCNPYQVDLWMGHELGESKGAYIVPDKEKQKKLYMQYMGFLIIEESQDPTTNPEYLKVIRENENLSRLTALSVLEYRDMKDELEWLKNGIDRATLELKTLPGYHTPQEELTLTQREKDILALKRRSRGPLAELADTIHKLK